MVWFIYTSYFFRRKIEKEILKPYHIRKSTAVILLFLGSSKLKIIFIFPKYILRGFVPNPPHWIGFPYGSSHVKSSSKGCSLTHSNFAKIFRDRTSNFRDIAQPNFDQNRHRYQYSNDHISVTNWFLER